MDPSDIELHSAWKDLNCSEVPKNNQGALKVDWPLLLLSLSSVPFPEVLPSLQAPLSVLRTSEDLDVAALECPLGVGSIFYVLGKGVVEGGVEVEEGKRAERGLRYFSLMENYVSQLHPDLIDESPWPLSDLRISELWESLLYLAREEKVFFDQPYHPRVYVYSNKDVKSLKSIVRGRSFCSRGQWGADVLIHDYFQLFHSVPSPHLADFFFVPSYAICLLEGNQITYENLNLNLINLINELPYFNRSGGRDHIFSFASGMSVNVFKNWEKYIKNSIFLTPETEFFNDISWQKEPSFNFHKDILIPGNIDVPEILQLAESSLPLPSRDLLAVFTGSCDRSRGPHPWVGGVDVRTDLLALNNEDDVIILCERVSQNQMFELMGRSKFCFVPRGKSGWSIRYFESLLAGCVPVVLSDLWEAPFSEFIDVSGFTIKWPMGKTDQSLITYLRNIPADVVRGMREKSQQCQTLCWFLFPPFSFSVRAPLYNLSKLCAHNIEERQHVDCNPHLNDEKFYKDSPIIGSAFDGIRRALMKKRRASWHGPSSFFGYGV